MSSEIEAEVQRFSKVDYVVFVSLLTVSAVIGVYYGFFSKKKQNNAAEYLLGGKSMQTIPVSISLVASSISGFALLGVPAEIYSQGSQYLLIFYSYVILSAAIWFVFLPVFSELQCPSVFYYLEQRFDKRVRVTSSILYGISIIFYVPVTIYIPALAFNQTTGISVHYVTPVACLVCMFYTSFGGVRAVVWTDTLQFMSMLVGIFLVIYMGMQNLGLGDVYDAVTRGGRLTLNMDPDPFLRTTFWTMMIGAPFGWIASVSINPTIIQRFLSLPNKQSMKNAIFLFTIGLFIIMGTNCFIGLLMYAHYESCDPFTAKRITKIDQILPYFIMDVAEKLPGLPGLFVAGIFSAALSTMSSCWNTLAGTIYEDLIYPQLPKRHRANSAGTIMKGIVFVLGLITIGLVFVVERLGTVFSLVISIQGVTFGALLGIFSFGMMCRRGNTTGVITGSITAFVVLTGIVIGALFNGHDSTTLPFRTDGCEGGLNATLSEVVSSLALVTDKPQSVAPETGHSVFEISFMYYAMISVFLVWAIGYPVSVLTSGYSPDDERLFTPWFRRGKTTQVTVRDVDEELEGQLKPLRQGADEDAA